VTYLLIDAYHMSPKLQLLNRNIRKQPLATVINSK